MKTLVEKMLNSGLVDKATAKIMEQWGLLPEGSVDKTKEDALKNATKEELLKLAEDLATEAERAHLIRETSLDLDRIRWPAEVNIIAKGEYVAQSVQAVVDRMGRYYFRSQDVQPEWFVPGYVVKRKVAEGNALTFTEEYITESQMLFVGEQPVCIQVTTKKGE